MAMGMLEHDRLQRKTLEQELALLQFREKYHEFQQELASRKELSILENDYLCRAFPRLQNAARGEWMAQVVYQPHDIMCGDSYSLRRLPEGMLVLIADAMGKGLAASLTTTFCAHTFNNLANALVDGAPFRFEAFVRHFTGLMRKLQELKPTVDRRIRVDLAVQAQAGLQPDIVILDMNMPGLGGSGTLPCLRALNPMVPVLIATGRIDQTALDQWSPSMPSSTSRTRSCSPEGIPDQADYGTGAGGKSA